MRRTEVRQPVWQAVLHGGTVTVAQTLLGAMEVTSMRHSGTGAVQVGAAGQ